MTAAEGMIQIESVRTSETEDRARSTDPVVLAAIREVRAGRIDAFETVMIRTERRVATLAWRILGDAEEVREAIQETFLRVFRHIDRYDESRDFHGWLYRIAVNVCRDLDRRRKRRGIRHAELRDTHQAPEHDRPDLRASRAEEIELLTKAVDQLPAKQRLALILRDIEGLPTNEVAEILGGRPATVRVQVSTARSKVRRLIERWQKERSDEL